MSKQIRFTPTGILYYYLQLLVLFTIHYLQSGNKISWNLYCRCSSDRIKFAQQDDADDVHNKPEEGSLTFSDGKLTGWVKFPGQKAVKIRGKRWGEPPVFS